MTLLRFDASRDANEAEIVQGLRQIGASVYRLSAPCDLLVGWRGSNYLLECKLPLGPKGGRSASDLTPNQQVFFRDWQGYARIVRSLTEALEAIGALTPGETKHFQ